MIRIGHIATILCAVIFLLLPGYREKEHISSTDELERLQLEEEN